ncbi:hypothetical protein [Lutibacter sp.]
MIFIKKIIGKKFHNVSILVVVLILLQSCNVYKDPINLEQAAIANEEGYFKVTMLNGDEYVYEAIESIDNKFYGITSDNEKKIKTILLKNEVKKVEKQNKKSSNSIGLSGIVIGVGSILLGVFMFGS